MTSMAAGRKGPPRLSGFFNVVSPRLSHSPGPSLLSSTRPPASLFFFFGWGEGGGCGGSQGLARLYLQGRLSGQGQNFDLLQGFKTRRHVCHRRRRDDRVMDPPTASRQDAGRMDKTAGPLSFNLETC